MERKSAIHPSQRSTYRIVGTPRELEILDLLQRFDVLPSHYVKAWVGKESATADRLTRLLQGNYINILEGKGVWCQVCQREHPFSEDAWDFARLRNVYYPLSIWPKGKALLAKRGLWVERKRQSDEFDHKMFRSIVDWSFAYGAREIGAAYETLTGILPRAPWRATKEDPDPSHIKVHNMSDLVPDSFVKIEDPQAFFAHIEIDNNTETQYGKGAENTIQGKVKRYAQYLRERGFNKRYGLPKITILFFFNRKGRVQTFLDVVRDTVKEPDVRQRFAAMYVPDFRDSFPPPTGFALTNNYERMGEPLNILEIVNGKRESSQNLRASRDHQEGRSRAGASHGRDPEARQTAS